MTHHPIHDTETDAIVAMLEQAGLVETYTNDEGKVAYRLTPKAARSWGVRWRWLESGPLVHTGASCVCPSSASASG